MNVELRMLCYRRDNEQFINLNYSLLIANDDNS